MEASLKKTILIIIASIAGLLLLAALGVFLYFQLQFRVYHDDQYKFAIKYPSSWKVVIHPQKNVAVVFVRPKETAMDPLQENFNVTVQPQPNDIYTLEAFSGTIKAQMTAVFGKNINIVEDKPLHWSWHEGHEIAFEAPNPNHLKTVVAWGLFHNQAYILTFLGDMNNYDKDSFFVKEMIGSLQLQ